MRRFIVSFCVSDKIAENLARNNIQCTKQLFETSRNGNQACHHLYSWK